MQSIIDFLLGYGYLGAFVISFLAGSFIPFNSESVMAALTLAGLDVWLLLAYCTIGNTLGGYFNYWVGRMGNEEWIYRYLRAKPDKMARAKALIDRYGVWMGLLSWIPILGSVITIAMGMLRLNIATSAFSIFLGKFLRYLVIGLIMLAF